MGHNSQIRASALSKEVRRSVDIVFLHYLYGISTSSLHLGKGEKEKLFGIKSPDA